MGCNIKTKFSINDKVFLKKEAVKGTISSRTIKQICIVLFKDKIDINYRMDIGASRNAKELLSEVEAINVAQRYHASELAILYDKEQSIKNEKEFEVDYEVVNDDRVRESHKNLDNFDLKAL